MSAVFLKLLNMSIAASWLILAVLAARLLLKKAPRWIICLLWGLAGLRLLCPFSLQSGLSLIPNPETVPANIALSPHPAIQSGITAVNEAVNPVLERAFAPAAGDSANPLQVLLPILSLIWALGAAALLLYALLSFLRLRRSVAASVPAGEGVWACDELGSPFILGLFRPRIYVPSALDGETLACVLRHEQAHLRRLDHWWKPLGFLLLTVYWFNPLCWLAYVLLCRDIEAACDERVLRDLDRAGTAAYSQALLDCGLPRRRIAACPLAFGELGVRQRVKRALHYKKPAFWVVLAALVACALLAVCFLTNPREKPKPSDGPVPSLVYDGVLYYSTGREEPVEPDESAVVGRIASVVSPDQWPWENLQANFDAAGAPVASVNGTLYVRTEQEWVRFAYAEDQSPASRFTFYATILELNDQYLLVQPVEGSSELRSCDKIYVPIRNMPPSPAPWVGDTVEIVYDGLIMETYPGQIGKVDSIRIVDQKGSKEEMTVKVVRSESTEEGGLLAERCQNADKLGGGTELHYPVFRCETKAELEEFKALYEQIVLPIYSENLEPLEPVDQVGEYKEGFFAGRFLLIAYVEAESGSLRYGLRDVTAEGGQLCMNVVQTNPVGRTCDMAAWLVIAELPKSMLEGVTGFDARLVGIEPEGN